MIRKAIALFLIAGSLAFAALILFKDKTRFLPPEQNIVSKNEELPKVGTGKINSTQKIAKNIAAELLKLNPEGPSLENDQPSIIAADPEKLVREIFPDQLKDIDLSFLNPEVKISDLKVADSSDKTLAENYFKNLQAILKNNLSGVSTLLTDPSKENFAVILKAYKAALPQLYQLVVPESLVNLHKEEIRLLTIERNIFENLANYENDPVMAAVSAQAFETAESKLIALIHLMVAFIKNNELRI